MGLKKIITNLFSVKKNDPRLNNLGSGKTFEEKYNELGVFEYHDDGFSVQYEDFHENLKWEDITRLDVYKRDLMTIDSIEMQITYRDKSITISEDLPGWYQFVLKTKSVFKTIPKDWNWEIVQPPFATNYRTIYSKAGFTQTP